MEKELYKDVSVLKSSARKLCSNEFNHYIDDVKSGMKYNRQIDETIGFY